MKKSWLLYTFSIILALVFIAPVAYIFKFVYLSADDFCRASLSFSDFGFNLRNWYYSHNGRFVNAIFSLLPIYKIEIYRATLAGLLVLLAITLYNFIRSVFKSYIINLEKAEIFFFTVLFLIVIIAQLPSLFEFFFWYAAASAYLVSFIFFLLFISHVLRFYLGGELKFYSFGFLIILLNGNNEVFLGITNFMILVLLIWYIIKNREWNKKLFILNILSWISSMAVIFSPGSLARRGHYEYGGNLYGSIKVAIIYGGKFIIESLLEIPLILLLTITFLLVYHTRKRQFTNYIKPLYLVVISYICIISMFFILYYAKGSLGVHNGRIGNIVFLVVLSILFLNVLNSAVYLHQKRNNIIFSSKFSLGLLSGILIISLLLNNTNYHNIREDIRKDNLVRYEEDMERRFRILHEIEDENVVLKPILETKLFKSDDPMLETQGWLRGCYKAYFNFHNSLKIKN